MAPTKASCADGRGLALGIAAAVIEVRRFWGCLWPDVLAAIAEASFAMPSSRMAQQVGAAPGHVFLGISTNTKTPRTNWRFRRTRAEESAHPRGPVHRACRKLWPGDHRHDDGALSIEEGGVRQT